ncbi:MAG: TfoX/Sxy family protein [Rhodanobacter sp.]
MDNIEIGEIFTGLGPVTIKRLFSGKGIYFEDVIVGIFMNGELLLKANAKTAPKFKAGGAKQWKHVGKQGKTTLMPYWTVPADTFDDPENMVPWVKLAFAAAVASK